MTQVKTKGVTMGWMPAWFYDSLVFLFTLGQEQSHRREIVSMATIQEGDKILDVGCGTGTLSILAAEEAGTTGEVVGIDPSENLLQRARAKAEGHTAVEARANNIRFQQGVAEFLPFTNDTFNVIFCTFTFHHLPDKALQEKALEEMKRVLKSGGTLLMVDFPEGDHFDWCCEKEEPKDLFTYPIVKRIEAAGFVVLEVDRIRMMNALGVLAHKPMRTDSASSSND
jgi:ubiquinone/menaquinone biosynthesis C-methylase UbiE